MSDTISYRSYAVEIAPGRFSRDHWRVEMWRTPDRGTDVNRRERKQRPTVDGKMAPEKRDRDRPRVLVREHVEPVNGLYRVVSVDIDHRSWRPVLAQCEGAVCAGHQRRFNYTEWRRPIRACNKCSAHARSLEFHASKEARDAAE